MYGTWLIQDFLKLIFATPSPLEEFLLCPAAMVLVSKPCIDLAVLSVAVTSVAMLVLSVASWLFVPVVYLGWARGSILPLVLGKPIVLSGA